MGYEELEFEQDSVFLVTGGAGFIGSNLCEALLRMGYKTRCLDNLSTGKKANIEPFLANPLFTFIEGDIRNLDTCLQACDGATFVLHQAAWGSVPRSIEMPLEYEDMNIRGTLNMMEAARQKKISKFVYASSSSVYGDEETLPKKEGKEGNLLSPYALTKRTNEEYGRLYKTLYGLDTYGLRYFNVFGKRQDPNGAYAAVIPRFIKQLLNDERPVINGDGSQSRDFTYIENVIEANLKACKASGEVSGRAYNIAFGGRKFLIDIYNDICSVLNVTIEPLFAKERLGDIKHSNADIGDAKRFIDYRPNWDFKKGIIETINWYRMSVH
jgi:UDP-N-acetylglucosamine/UDP-N-acetylgalactosamine 4-epimerase